MTDDKPDTVDVEARLDRLFDILWTAIRAEKPIPLRETEKIVSETLRELHEAAPDSTRVTFEFCRVFFRSNYGIIVAPYLVERWGPVASKDFRLASLASVRSKTDVELTIEQILTAPPPKIKAAWDSKGISFGSTIDKRRGLIDRLGYLDDPAAVPFLIAVLLKKEKGDRNWELRMRAARSLSRISDPRAIEPLIKVFKSLLRRWMRYPSSDRDRLRMIPMLRRFKNDPRVAELGLPI